MLRLFFFHLAATLVSSALVLAAVYFGTMRLLENQTAAVVEAELRGLVEDYGAGGQFALRSAIARRINSKTDADAVYLFSTNSGSPIAGNLLQWPDGPLDGKWRKIDLIRTDTNTRVLVGGRAFMLPGGGKLFVGRDLREQRQFRKILGAASSALLFFFLLSGTLGGFAVSRAVLRRVDSIGEAAGAIAAGDISRRAPVTGANDEFDRLAISLNTMLSKNEALIGELRMVTDSLAHDLRTPLAHLRARLETLAASKEPDPAAIEAALSEVDYVQGVFASLIDISRAEAGLSRDQFEEVDLCEIVGNAADFYSALAEEKSVTISSECKGEIKVRGHAQFLARAVANLLDNAVKYSPAGSRIIANTSIKNGKPQISVCDHGVGVSEPDWPNAVKRFARLGAERPLPGAGLGLSLVATVARLHDAELVRTDDNPGLCVSIVFPEEKSFKSTSN